MPKILITGVNGFVGHHLTQDFTNQGCEIHGVGLQPAAAPDLAKILSGYHSADLTNIEQVNKLPLADVDAVINLAGLANVGDSYKNPELYMQVNVQSLVNICESSLRQNASPRIIVISTGAVYDNHQPMPLAENAKLVTKSSPYAQSKIVMEQKAHEYNEKGLDCIIVRPFNHIGSGQGRGFIVPDMYHKLAWALKSGELVKTGDLSTKRDYTDVRDVVRAYRLLALAKPQTLSSRRYNVCSGVTHSGEEIVNEIKKNIPGSETLKTEIDPSLIRPDEQKELKGSNKLINKDIGWSPSIPFEQTIKDALP